MMGGAWYDHYIGNKDSNAIYQLAFNEIKKHLNLKVDPDFSDVSVLKVYLKNLERVYLLILSKILIEKI